MFPNHSKPTEGSEIIKFIGEERWFIYGDPFSNALETIDLKIFSKIEVSTPSDAMHCSFMPITKTELALLIKFYPPKK